MKEIKLINLKLVNFKGIKEFELNPNGNDMSIFGDNGTGKTTLPDAVNWLLFDKDSQNRKDFEIKTLRDGKPIPKLDHEVEATFLVDGNELTLKKVYKEKYTKKRGQITAEFTGNTTNHYVDDVPKSKKEYTEVITGLVDENIFKLLTNPMHFNEHLHWKDQRKILLEISGDVSDEDVIQSNPSIKDLTDILNGRSIDDHKKAIAEQRKKINQEVERIPIRIDEINRGLPDLTRLDKESIESEITQISKDIEAKQQQINDIKNGSEVNSLKQKTSETELKISNVKNEHEQQNQQDLYKYKSRLQEEQSNLSILESKLKQHENYKSTNSKDIATYTATMTSKRNEWIELNEQELHYESDCNCPTCGQELPNEQIESARQRALELFNADKSERLEALKKQGLELKEKVEQIQEDNEKLDKDIEKLNLQIKEKQSEITKFDKKIEQAQTEIKPIEENADYIELMNEKQALEQQIISLNQSVEESVQAVQTELNEMKSKENELQLDLNKFTQTTQAQERISELEEQEKKLADEFEELERQLYLTEEFTKTKVNMLEDKISSKFKFTRFNLFEEQLNGGVTEICEATFDGVPFSKGLNNAARISVGLDVIDTLSKHYGVRAPIFIDNAESITELPEIKSQTLALFVSKKDKKLRIEESEDYEKVS